MFVKPEEKRFVTAELIRSTSFTAGEAEIKQRIDALRGAGYTQFTIQLVPGPEQALADWARLRNAFLPIQMGRCRRLTPTEGSGLGLALTQLVGAEVVVVSLGTPEEQQTADDHAKGDE